MGFDVELVITGSSRQPPAGSDDARQVQRLAALKGSSEGRLGVLRESHFAFRGQRPRGEHNPPRGRGAARRDRVGHSVRAFIIQRV